MGFRDPVTSATDVDTGRGLADAGVRLFQDLSIPSVPRGVAEWRTGLMDRNATAELSGGGSGGSNFAISGGATEGVNAPELDLNVEGAGIGGYVPVARLLGAAGGFLIDGPVVVQGQQLGQPPVTNGRTANVVGLAVAAASSASPAGTGLTLPVLPADTRVTVYLAGQFYAEGSGVPQTCRAEITATNATRLAGNGEPALSMTSLVVAARCLAVYRITSGTVAATFGSTYTAGANSNRCILQREDWTVLLP